MSNESPELERRPYLTQYSGRRSPSEKLYQRLIAETQAAFGGLI
jgi:hypothetical protein